MTFYGIKVLIFTTQLLSPDNKTVIIPNTKPNQFQKKHANEHPTNRTIRGGV
jgi:hypothetical protein